MSLIHNERTKLSANWLNTIAAAFVVAGVIAPIVAFFYELDGPNTISFWKLGPGTLIWYFTGFGLHFIARYILGGLHD